MNIIVCEDNAPFSTFLKESIEDYFAKKDYKTGKVIECMRFDTIKKIVTQSPIDVILLDISLGDKSPTGYEIAQFLHENHPQIRIVFISENLEYVFQAFKVRAFDFLPKPLTQSKLYTVLDRIEKDKVPEHKAEDHIALKLNGEVFRVAYHDLVMIEKDHNKIIIHMKQRIVSCYLTLEAIEAQLPQHEFVRVHRSFIIHLKEVVHIDFKKGEIELTGGLKSHIGHTYKKKLRTFFE